MPLGMAHLNAAFWWFHLVAFIAFLQFVQRLLGADV